MSGCSSVVGAGSWEPTALLLQFYTVAGRDLFLSVALGGAGLGRRGLVTAGGPGTRLGSARRAGAGRSEARRSEAGAGQGLTVRGPSFDPLRPACRRRVSCSCLADNLTSTRCDWWSSSQRV